MYKKTFAGIFVLRRSKILPLRTGMKAALVFRPWEPRAKARAGSILAILIFAAGCKQKAKEPTVTPPMTEELSLGTTTTTLQPPSTPAEAQIQTQGAAPLGAEQREEPAGPLEFMPPSEKEIQQALANAGLYDGGIDGKIGPKTEKAVEEFQTKNNLKVDGKVGAKTWAKLKEYLSQNLVPASTGIKD